MTPEDLQAILTLGTQDEDILEILRQQQRQEGIADETRGRDYLVNAGRMSVANPYGAISDMFVRGKAEKKAKKLKGEAKEARAARDSAVNRMVRGMLGMPEEGMEPVDNGMGVSQGRIPISAPPLSIPQVPEAAYTPPPAPRAPAPAPAPKPPGPPPGASAFATAPRPSEAILGALRAPTLAGPSAVPPGPRATAPMSRGPVAGAAPPRTTLAPERREALRQEAIRLATTDPERAQQIMAMLSGG